MTPHSSSTGSSPTKDRSETIATTVMLVGSVILFIALAVFTPLEMIPRMLITLAVSPLLFGATRGVLKRGTT